VREREPREQFGFGSDLEPETKFGADVADRLADVTLLIDLDRIGA
jgi:hypothetical protein